MKSLKKIVCLVLVAIMIMTFTACSTPKVAITVDGKEYSTGEYLAYLMDTFQQMYYSGSTPLYSIEAQGVDVWAYTQEYEGKTVDLAGYMKETAIDAIVQQKALENMMKEAGVEADEELVKNVKEQMLDPIDEQALLSFGISKESYTKMCMAVYCNYMSLFLSRYDKDGTSPVPEADIRKYFDDNYLSIKMISVEMMKDEKEMSEADQKKVKDDLKKYLNMYNSGKKSFNEVIAQYNYDISTSSDKKLETLTDDDTRQNLVVEDVDDKQFTDAIKSIPEGKAELVTFKSGGKTLTAAVILRMDPEKGEGDAYKDVFKNNRQSVLVSMKGKAFDADIKKVADELKVDINQQAYDMCNPRDFVR